MIVATALSVGVGYRRVRAGASRRGWLRDAGEVAVLWAWFLLAAPVFAIGVYFALWHALRHVGRLVLVDPDAAAALGEGDARRALARFARDAAPLTLGGSSWLARSRSRLPPASPRRATCSRRRSSVSRR